MSNNIKVAHSVVMVLAMTLCIVGCTGQDNAVESVAVIAIESKKEQWPFPKIFQQLKDAGVASYEVKIADCNAVYQGDFGSWKEPVPEGFYHLRISSQFDKNALVDVIKRQIAKKTTYIQFLGGLAPAGVDHYVVSMSDRTITYYGIDANDFYVQHVPQLS